MDNTLVFETRNFALELYHLLKELDPVRWKQTPPRPLEKKLLHLESEVHRLYAKMQSMSSDLYAKVQQKYGASALGDKLRLVGELLKELRRSYGEGNLSRDMLHALRKRLENAYQDLSLAMEAYSVTVPKIRPTNYARTWFHIQSAMFTLFLVEKLPSPTWQFFLALAFALFCWTMEGLVRLNPGIKTRVMAFFSKAAHPHEYHKINSATWYATALVGLSLLQNPLAIGIALCVLGFADPAAALVGRRYGKIRLPGNRSLEGSLAFFLVGSLAAFTLIITLHPLGSLWQAAAVAASAGLAGALGELAGSRLDDNLTIPWAAAAGALLALGLV